MLQAAAATTLASLPLASNPQVPPEPMRLIVGFPAGGGADAITRWIGNKLIDVLARTVVVENRAGAGGRLAVETLKGSSPDGLTMLLTPSSVVTMYPFVYAKLAYDPLMDLSPVSQVCDFVHGLAVGPAVPDSVRSLQNFVTWCKANPSKADCGNTGDGTMPHFLTIMLSRDMGVKIGSISYRGTAPALTDLLGGQLTSLIAPEGSFTSQVADGKVRLLATSGAQRSRFFPKVATFAEQGAKSIVASEWFGMFMPSKTSPASISRAAEAVRAAVQTPDMAEKLAKFGMVAIGSSPAELNKRLQADTDFWRPTVKASGFTPLTV